MIMEFFCNIIFILLNGFCSFLPRDSTLPSWVFEFQSLCLTAFNFFPVDVFVAVVGCVVFWTSAQITWAIVEWVYKKLPGVN